MEIKTLLLLVVSTAGNPVGLQTFSVTTNSDEGAIPGSGDWGVRNIAFQFEASLVAIPEPTSVCLLAFAGLGLIGRRRR